MKMHVALNTPQFDESVRFYRTFLGLEPVKLNASPDRGPGGINHLGIQVSSTEAVRAAADRLKAEGLATFEEENIDCCYALKVGDTSTTAPTAPTSTDACCASTCCHD